MLNKIIAKKVNRKKTPENRNTINVGPVQCPAS